MNWMCDVYVYAHVNDGWVTHVAGRRRPIPPIPDYFMNATLPTFGAEWVKESRSFAYPSPLHRMAAKAVYKVAEFWHNKIHMASLSLIPLRPIGLPHDGENFCDETPIECAARLESLRAIGYIVPQYAIDALREEQSEMEGGK